MKITQHYYEPLSQSGYLVSHNGKAIAIDPLRDITPIVKEIDDNSLELIGVILTHPHADFVSGHLSMAQKYDVPIYTHSLVNPGYASMPFDEGDEIKLGDVLLRSLHTPGHSPDSISVVAQENGVDKAVFTGDTLFVGDVGRPDLREGVGHIKATRESLARNMYASTRNKLMKLEDTVAVYPAHGPGTLCGKNLSPELSSTIGRERAHNPALQDMTEDQFVEYLLADQPFMPQYFGYDVELNRQENLDDPELVAAKLKEAQSSEKLLLDVRNEDDFRKNHAAGAINIPANDDDKFETWVGSIIAPKEPITIYAGSQDEARNAVQRLANIGYETQVSGYVLHDAQIDQQNVQLIDANDVQTKQSDFTIVDVRNKHEINGAYFDQSINIPLHELRERLSEIPGDKPVAVHCAGGYRSDIGASIVATSTTQPVYDISDSIKQLSLAN